LKLKDSLISYSQLTFLNFGVGLVNPKPQGEKNMQEGTINVPNQYVSLNI